METGVGEDVLGNYTRVVSQLGRGEGTCVCVSVCLTCRRRVQKSRILDSSPAQESTLELQRTADTLFHLTYFTNK